VTFLIIAAAVGAALGGWIGFKVGRTVEKVRPSKKDEAEKEKDEKPRRKLPHGFDR